MSREVSKEEIEIYDEALEWCEFWIDKATDKAETEEYVEKKRAEGWKEINYVANATK